MKTFIDIFMYPAQLLWESDGWSIPIYGVMFLLAAVGLIFKRYEANSRVARISKVSILTVLCIVYGLWLPLSLIMSGLWL